MKSILVLTILCAISSGCAGVQRPDADICGINFASDAAAHLTCYNIRSDFDANGTLIAGHHSHRKPIGQPQSLNAGKYISKEDWPKFQVWLQDIRSWSQNHCQ